MNNKNIVGKNKIRIFVDGSCDDSCGISTIAYNIQDGFINGKKFVKLDFIHNKCFSTKTRSGSSIDAEIDAIELGFNTFLSCANFNPIFKKYPVRVKSDSMIVIKYITKKKNTGNFAFNEAQLHKMDLLHIQYKCLRTLYPNFKLSYIPSKKNLAHYNAYEKLKWERSLVTNNEGVVENG